MDDLDAELSYLMNQLEGEPGDSHALFFRLHQILETFRAEGLPVPENLLKIEQALDAQFKKDAEGSEG
jgi:phage-related holin